jgi:hypothetical protein
MSRDYPLEKVRNLVLLPTLMPEKQQHQNVYFLHWYLTKLVKYTTDKRQPTGWSKSKNEVLLLPRCYYLFLESNIHA